MKYKKGEVVYLLPETPEGKQGVPRMEPYLGKAVTIADVRGIFYEIVEDNGSTHWYDYDIDHKETNRLRYVSTKGV